MKKLTLVLALILALAVMLVSCAKDETKAPENNEEVVENNNETPEETPDAPEASGAVLIKFIYPAKESVILFNSDIICNFTLESIYITN